MPWRRTPGWISVGGGWLALTAGFVNAIGYLGINQRGVSHVTGQVTQLGIEVAQADLPHAGSAALLILSFFAGATLSGAIIRRPELTVGHRRYGWALALEAVLLAAGALLLPSSRAGAENLIALSMGLQNALASSYSGAVVRTTHVTGLVTDLGLLLGHALRGEVVEPLKARLLVVLLLAFIAGALLGGLAFARLGIDAVLLTAAGVGAAAASYLVTVSRLRAG